MLKGLYKTQMDVVMGSTKDYSLATFGKKSWYTLWGSGKIEKTSAPKIVTNPDECIVLGKDNETKGRPIGRFFVFVYKNV